MENETYLGDAVYASFDGYQIKLRCSAPSEFAAIYLEPQTWYALEEFVKKIKEGDV